MEMKQIIKKIAGILRKYRYAVLILCVGIVFMILPSQNKEVTVQETVAEPTSEISVEERLSAILSNVDGAGKTKVFLTESAGAETVYQVDEQIRTNTESKETKRETITGTDTNKDSFGLVRQVIPAKYLGAIVVCQGADDPAVKLAIVEAVSKATGLGANRISVLKMK